MSEEERRLLVLVARLSLHLQRHAHLESMYANTTQDVDFNELRALVAVIDEEESDG